ncbi:hypothetical protein DL766_008549 [Monosporascus sp. MC13-8B]|uniref:Stc1 domain-containing protein n=1 Tax=Monosporascus cannonballus TaxID=155416 RepID=A0ABY0HDP9_9PEZI|nr:hypothetical protein DL763_006955 [Monosporascus cannonballus]RYO91113.1 hypothetical protein DL762_002409 [Monosporascus cannonballus]RYP19035.1 hypothetical protein DL766_008549 [Monosporascus sp. MC13-8B]
MLRLTRGRSGSESSQASQSLLRGPDLHLPDRSSVFVTRTKSGKPAFARRKNNDLLQDFGFDLLGQSFGVPSRADLERQLRHTHNASQSSGLIALPDKSQYPAGKPTSNNEEFKAESERLPLVVGKKDPNAQRPPTPPRGILKRPRDDAYFATYDGLGHPPVGYPHTSSMGFQPPPPPPGHFPCSKHWLGGVLPLNVSSYQHQPPQHISHVPGYHPQVAYHGATPSWVSPQAQAAPQYVNPLGYPGPQTASAPILPTQHPYPPYLPYTAPAPHFIPGPPPPSLSPGFQGPMATSLRDNHPNLDTSNVKDAEVCYNPATISPGGPHSNEESAEKNKIEDDAKVNRNGSKRIRHYHICAGCGKRRSRDYQKAHPLRRGEIPKPAYCARCIREADFSNSELSNSDTADDHSFIQRGLGTTRSSSSSDDEYDVRRNRYASSKLRHRSREKRSGRLGLFSSIASKLRGRAQSLSSAEESSSRASSPIRVRRVRHRRRKHPSSSKNYVHSASKRSLLPQDVTVSGKPADIRKIPETVVDTVSHDKQIESSRKRNANDSQESVMRSEKTDSAASLTIPKIVEIVSRAINDNKGSDSPIALALETGKAVLGEVLAPEPNKSHASCTSSKEPRPEPIEIPDPTASKLSSQGGLKESNLISPGSPILPNTPRKDVDPSYRRPSVRNEGSELLVEHFDMHHKESNCTAVNEPVSEEPTPKPHRESPKDGCEQKDPIEQFIPFPESAKSTTFGTWDENQFPDPDESPKDMEFPSMWEPLTPTGPHISGRTAFPRFMDDEEDS